MSDTAAGSDRHELVPGVSAYQLERIHRWVMIGAPGSAIAFTGNIWQTLQSDTGIRGQDIAPLGAVFAVSLLMVVVSSAALGLRAGAEASAGYTTRTSGDHNLDQVDPATGVVIRYAGSVVFTTPERSGDTPGTVSEAVGNGSSLDKTVRFVDLPSERRTRKIGRWGLAIFVTVAIIAIFGVPIDGPAVDFVDRLLLLQGLLALVAGAGVLIALVFMAATAFQRSKLRVAAAVRPESFVFLARRTPELIDALKAIGIDRPCLRLHFAVTLGPEGVELWSDRETDVPRVALHWSDISHVHPGRLTVSGLDQSFVALTLHIFQSVDGRPLDLPLPIFARRGMLYARTERANEVLGVCARYASVA